MHSTVELLERQNALQIIVFSIENKPNNNALFKEIHSARKFSSKRFLFIPIKRWGNKKDQRKFAKLNYRYYYIILLNTMRSLFDRIPNGIVNQLGWWDYHAYMNRKSMGKQMLLKRCVLYVWMKIGYTHLYGKLFTFITSCHRRTIRIQRKHQQ